MALVVMVRTAVVGACVAGLPAAGWWLTRPLLLDPRAWGSVPLPRALAAACALLSLLALCWLAMALASALVQTVRIAGSQMAARRGGDPATLRAPVLVRAVAALCGLSLAGLAGPAGAAPVAPGPGSASEVPLPAAAPPTVPSRTAATPGADGSPGDPWRGVLDGLQLPERVAGGLPPGRGRAYDTGIGVGGGPGSPPPAALDGPASGTSAPSAGHDADRTGRPGRSSVGPPADDSPAHPRAGVPSAAPSGPVGDADAARVVRVRPGDTLWHLAELRLPRGADDAAICGAWHALYAANRTVVGPDPDLILPGTLLRLPHDDPAPRKDAS